MIFLSLLVKCISLPCDFSLSFPALPNFNFPLLFTSKIMFKIYVINNSIDGRFMTFFRVVSWV